MTRISTHVYAARESTTDTVLSLTRGSVTLDADNVPHVTAQLTLAVEDPLLLNVLDPRAGRRVEITAVRDGGTPRVFDLGIRTVLPDRAAGTVEIEAASDEAILTDIAPLTDDKTPRGLESSLRAVVDYVLGKIGAELEPGAVDADVTAYWSLTNLLPNPAVSQNVAFWRTGDGASTLGLSTSVSGMFGGSSLFFTAAGTGLSRGAAYRVRVEPGTVYSASAYLRGSDGAAGNNAAVWMQFQDSEGHAIEAHGAPKLVLSGTAWERSELLGVTAPAGADSVTVFVQNDAGPSGRNTRVSAAMLYEGDESVAYFDGATTPAGYVTEWSDAAHASPAKRTPLIERDPQSTIWPAGDSGMDFLHPLLSAAGFRLVCDEQRRWTLRDSEFRAPGSQTHRYGINIKSADEALSREDESWFDAAVYVYRWTVGGREHERVDAFALNDPPTKVLRVELRNTPFPGTGRAEHIVRRAQGKGRTVTISRIPTWVEHTDQPLSITLDGTPIQTGIASRVQYDFDTDTVTVTSRTTDTPASAWVLIPAGETWLDSPAGESWTEEIT